MFSILYEGYVYGGYFKGWLDIVMQRGAYLLTLGNLGVTVISAYDDLTQGDTYSYQTVQDTYGPSISEAGSDLLATKQKCKDELEANTAVNAARVVGRVTDFGLMDF